MNQNRLSFFSCALVIALAGSTVSASGIVAPDRAQHSFQAANPQTGFYRTGNQVTSIYGRAFSFGQSAEGSAQNFITQHAEVLGVSADELTLGSIGADNNHLIQLMPRDDGSMKFSLVSYVQSREGIPVYRADVRLLVRNEVGFPLVLARSAAIALGDFAVDQPAAARPNIDVALANAEARFPGMKGFTPPQVVIYAGSVDHPARPALALVFEGAVGHAGDANYAKWRLFADAKTGAVIDAEDLIEHVNVTGNVSAQVTQGFKSAECNPEGLTALPYARASIGATLVYADASGNFTIPNAGTTAVTVVGSLQGKYFNVFNPNSLAPTVSMSVTPPGPANLVLNSANTNEQRRAEANAYYFANVARDFVLAGLPTYPTISGQTNFRVNTAVAGTCNAFYDGGSINFYNNGGGCANTAYSDVVEHEYGHHVVNTGLSGQGQYGEGTGDCMGVVLNDQPILGFGFSGDCASGIRSADNTYQYPQNGEIHDAGQLISGCVWDLRKQLFAVDPSGYKTTLGRLLINSVPLHAGDLITPQITIDYLTLDDDDSNILNGTPHYDQIQPAFSKHNMAGPEIIYMNWSFPTGLPANINPAGGTSFNVNVTANAGFTLDAASVKMGVDPESDGSFALTNLALVSPGVYHVTMPAASCGTAVRYYFTANTTNARTSTSPSGAPAAAYTTFSAVSTTSVFSDNFQTDKGWVATFAGGAIAPGKWERGVPVAGTNSAPLTDFDGSGSCFVTGNTATIDVDKTFILTSPTIAAAPGDNNLKVNYARWFNNNSGSAGDVFLVQASNDNGTTWTTVETVGPGGSDAAGGWIYKSFRVADFVAPNATLKFRFSASDISPDNTVEAALDAFQLVSINCGSGCSADFNGDGFLNGDDFDAYVAAFESGNISADFNKDGFVNGDDFDAFSTAFAAGC